MRERAPASVAIIGAGLMGRWHAHAAIRAGARVAVIVDPDRERAATLSARHAGSRTLDALDATRVARDAAVAHVCTPLATHESVIADLIGAGVHVLAEKPLTDEAGSTRTLLDAARARGVVLCPVHQMPFQRGVQTLIGRLATLGELLHVEFSACSAGAVGEGESEQDQLVDDILPHPLSLFRRVLGVEMASLHWQTTRPRPGELRTSAGVGSTVASMVVSTHGRPTSNSLRVVGTRGTATADLYHGFATLSRGRVSRGGKMLRPFADAYGTATAAALNLAKRAIAAEPAYPGLTSLVRAFYAAASDGAAPPISIEETLDIARTRDRLRAAPSRASA